MILSIDMVTVRVKGVVVSRRTREKGLQPTNQGEEVAAPKSHPRHPSFLKKTQGVAESEFQIYMS